MEDFRYVCSKLGLHSLSKEKNHCRVVSAISQRTVWTSCSDNIFGLSNILSLALAPTPCLDEGDDGRKREENVYCS